MGTDMLECIGRSTRMGNNATIHLELDDVAKAQRIIDGLADERPTWCPSHLSSGALIGEYASIASASAGWVHEGGHANAGQHDSP
jgi:hypothetical protein